MRDRRRDFIVMSSGGLPFPLSAFTGGGSRVSIQRITYSSYTGVYLLAQDLGGDRCFTTMLAGTMSVGGEFMRMILPKVERLVGAYNRNNGVTVSAGWSATVSDAQWGGRQDTTSNTNAYAELVTPAGVTEVGIYGLKNTTAGVQLVTIDGSKTAADLLPTAQQLVDAGTLVATALVGGGGTLNPTDRVYDMYAAAATATKTWFSQSLAAGAHTVRITNTGYRHTSATNDLVFLYAFLAYGPGVHTLDHPLPFFETLYTVESAVTEAVWEYAYNITPTGATNPEWIGHTGSFKFINLPAITVDGAAADPAFWANTGGGEIAVTMQFGARHTEIDAGATNIATVDMTYKINPTVGFSIIHSTTWWRGGSGYGYPGMLATDHSVFDRFATPAATAGADLTADDGSYHFNTREPYAWTWDADGYLGILMYIPNLQKSVANWAYSPNYQLIWEDMDGISTWKKSLCFQVWSRYRLPNQRQLAERVYLQGQMVYGRGERGAVQVTFKQALGIGGKIAIR